MAKLTKEQVKGLADDLTIEQVAEVLAHFALRQSKEFLEYAYEQGDLDAKQDGPLTATKIADDAGNWIYETWFHYGDLNKKIEKQINALKSQYKPAKK